MKTLNHFTAVNSVWFRAIEREKGPIAIFSQQLQLRHEHKLLKEILLVPQDENTISTRVLERVGLRSVDDLLEMINGSLPRHRDNSTLVKRKILECFFNDLDLSETKWNYSITYPIPKDGPVIAIVAGNNYAMRSMYSKGLCGE